MVEWKKLGDLCTIRTGKLNANAQVENGDYPFFTCDANPYKIDKYAFDTEALLLSGNGSQVGHLNYYKGKFNAYQRTYVLDKLRGIDILYLYHYMKGTIRQYVMDKSKKGSVPYITLPMLQDFRIPTPSLSEQKRIVGILDTFAASIDNLKAQIAQRRKQYEFYRDQLLDLEGKEGVEMKTLGEVGEICMCKRIMKEQTSDNGDIPFFKIGTFGGKADAYITRELFEDYKTKYSYPQKGEILLSAAGTIGRSVIFDGEDAYFQDSNIVWIANDEKLLSNKFLYYYYQVIDWKIDGGTIKRLYNYNLKNAVVPVPSLQEQQRIVSILDTFEASISNLEAQLEQREKQYEYYRNKLLTFE